MAEILAGRTINKTFGSFQVLKDVNFTLSQGEALGIVGPNGAGKTTLFSVVAGSLMGVDIDGDEIVDVHLQVSPCSPTYFLRSAIRSACSRLSSGAPVLCS